MNSLVVILVVSLIAGILLNFIRKNIIKKELGVPEDPLPDFKDRKHDTTVIANIHIISYLPLLDRFIFYPKAAHAKANILFAPENFTSYEVENARMATKRSLIFLGVMVVMLPLAGISYLYANHIATYNHVSPDTSAIVEEMEYDVSVVPDDSEYKISLEAKPSDYGAVYGEGEYSTHAPIELEAEPKEGVIFVGWANEEMEILSTERVFEPVSLQTDREFTAIFEDEPSLLVKSLPMLFGLIILLFIVNIVRISAVAEAKALKGSVFNKVWFV